MSSGTWRRCNGCWRTHERRLDEAQQKVEAKMILRAVLFDIDFTLARPGPDLLPEGYVRCGERHGLELVASRYQSARDAALVDLRRHPELDHDEEIWVAFTERIVVGMGGAGPVSRDVAVELTSRWQRHENFELYEDVIPVLGALRRAGLRIGLVSNSARDVRDFARHHALEIDAGISSFHHGKTKPHASIFNAVLELLEVEPGEAAMVGDTVEDDVEGALALGMRAVLVDRLALRPEFEPRVADLYALPVVLGLTPTLRP
jgi:HAD superfamily hydrolase (TIGR01662 family)